ncbi:MAG TPA: hypothetical protein VHX38_12500 [Pseudonocardiaceae bacterium]|nr:hypothetical protein [Pseudonocardiaceae bacterium]
MRYPPATSGPSVRIDLARPTDKDGTRTGQGRDEDGTRTDGKDGTSPDGKDG